jgi:chorismate mutase
MVSLITGIITEELMGAQREDEVRKIAQIEKSRSELSEHTKALLQTFDEDRSGALSVDELTRALSNPKVNVLTKLKALDIDVGTEDLLQLVYTLQKSLGKDEIPIDHFGDALNTLSGNASSSSIWDLKMLLAAHECRREEIHDQLQTAVREISSKTDDKIERITDRVDKLDGKLTQLLDNLSLLRQEQLKSTQMSSKVDKVMTQMEMLGSHVGKSFDTTVAQIQALEEKHQSRSSRIEDRIDRLIERVNHAGGEEGEPTATPMVRASGGISEEEKAEPDGSSVLPKVGAGCEGGGD